MSALLEITEKLKGERKEGKGSGFPLSVKIYAQAMEEILSGNASDDEISQFLKVQASIPLGANALLGTLEVLKKHQTPLQGLEKWKDELVDTCGTGGDGHHTFNISTTAAFVVAGAGGFVAKHGNRSASSKSGSADCLEALGVPVDLDPEKSLTSANLAFLFAPKFHPAMKKVASVRKKLKIRTLFNFIGPLANPAQASFQLLGISGESFLMPMAKALSQMPIKKAWVVQGKDGLDEISLTTETKVMEVKGKRINAFLFDSKKYGFSLCKLRDLVGGNPKENALITESILKGEKGAKRDIVLLNSAACLLLSGKAKDFDEGLTLSKNSIDQGKALECLSKLRELKS